MNVHHLELFYYVARHGGISEAVRNIPYGIQQPAVSSQVLLLEEFLGVVLFHRRPFALTPAGQKLYAFIEPFFSQVERVAQDLQGGVSQQVRFGASEIILREHLPDLLLRVREKHPQMRLTLRQGYQPELESWIEKQELDMAVTVLQKRLPAGINSLPLLTLPLVLLLPKGSKYQSPEDLWKKDRIEESLICLPPTENLCKNFQQDLARKGVDWYPKMEVSSLDLIETYVSNGYGIGLSVDLPHRKPSHRLRQLPLKDFEPVTLGLLWQGKLTGLTLALMDEIQKYVKEMAKAEVRISKSEGRTS